MTQTHPILDIKPRTMPFTFDDVEERYWYKNNPFLSCYWTALSATFPPGEKQFIDSVRTYRDQIKNPVLSEQVAGFIGQEAQHSKQHHGVNLRFDELGLHATRIEDKLETYIQKVKTQMLPEYLLASTVCMEHLTAIFADLLLTKPEFLDPMPASLHALFKWHVVEEIEHKSVAFDVFMECVGDRNILTQVMKWQTIDIIRRIHAYAWSILLWNRKIPTPKQTAEAAKFFWGKEGFYRQLHQPWKAFYAEDFHPWHHDNRYLVEQWKKAA